MKPTKFPTILAVSAVGGLLICSAVAQQKQGAVKFEPNAVVFSGVKLSDADQKAVDDILKYADKSLYKVSRVENGKLVTRGKLKDLYIKSEGRSTKINTAGGGMTNQIGFDWYGFTTPTPTIWAGLDRDRSEDLVRRVTHVLQKHNKQ
jgi:hypothetical protein